MGLLSAAENLPKLVMVVFIAADMCAMLVTAGAGDDQAICCDSAGVQQASGDGAGMPNDNQHRDAVVERQSSCTVTSAYPRYESHLQRGLDRSYFSAASVQGEA